MRARISWPGENPSLRFHSVGSSGLPATFFGIESRFMFTRRPVGVVASATVNQSFGNGKVQYSRLRKSQRSNVGMSPSTCESMFGAGLGSGGGGGVAVSLSRMLPMPSASPRPVPSLAVSRSVSVSVASTVVSSTSITLTVPVVAPAANVSVPLVAV